MSYTSHTLCAVWGRFFNIFIIYIFTYLFCIIYLSIITRSSYYFHPKFAPVAGTFASK